MSMATLARYLPPFLSAWRYIQRRREEKALARHEARMQEFRELAELHDLEREQYRNME